MILLTDREFKELVKQSIKLDILESDGVDNWSWYMEGTREYVANYFGLDPNDFDWEDDIDDVAEDILQKRKEWLREVLSDGQPGGEI